MLEKKRLKTTHGRQTHRDELVRIQCGYHQQRGHIRPLSKLQYVLYIEAKSIKILEEADKKKKKLGMETQLLMALEYRTYFHVSQRYGISESSCYKGIKWIEDTLIKHPDFALPGKKALLKSDLEYEVVLIDATETPITYKKSQ